MKRGDWPCTLSHRLRGSTLGIFGLGAIGQLVAESRPRAGYGDPGVRPSRVGGETQAAGYAVAATRLSCSNAPTFSRFMCGCGRIRPELSLAEDLARMKPTALLVNTSRAELIAAGALLDALRKGGRVTRPSMSMSRADRQRRSSVFVDAERLCTPHLGWAEWTNFRTLFPRNLRTDRAVRAGRGVAGLPIRRSFRAGHSPLVIVARRKAGDRPAHGGSVMNTVLEIICRRVSACSHQRWRGRKPIPSGR